MKQLCDVLTLLHQYQIIHRDIKPDNIFYDKEDVILFDYDIARTYHPALNKDTTVLGSVGYAAPEQFGFKQSDARTDKESYLTLCSQNIFLMKNYIKEKESMLF